jgi:hypothetical protein
LFRGGDYLLTYSHATLKYAITLCLSCVKYRVGITLSNTNTAFQSLFKIIEIDNLKQKILRISKRKSSFCIIFKNGSIIDIFLPTDSPRGYAYHLMIVGEDVDKDIVNRVLRPAEKLEYIEQKNVKQRL